jgi:hypothetical protein
MSTDVGSAASAETQELSTIDMALECSIQFGRGRTNAEPGSAQGMFVASLAELLYETSIRQGSFEAVDPPHDWWDWYAAYMDARQSGSSPDEASAAADRYMAEVKDVVVSPA